MSEAGFTLIEALAATVLLAMILAALSTITAQWLPNWNRGMVRIQASDQIALALERIVADLSAAEFVTAGNDSHRPVFDGTDRSVLFVRITLGPHALAGLDLVQIGPVNVDSASAVARSRGSFAAVMTGVPQRQPLFSESVVLLRGSYHLSFAYAGDDRVWHPSWRSQGDLPKTIRISLQDLTAQRSRSMATAVAGYAKAPVECLSAKSLTDCRALRHQPASVDVSKAR
jgi:general secretion pathway protein J